MSIGGSIVSACTELPGNASDSPSPTLRVRDYELYLLIAIVETFKKDLIDSPNGSPGADSICIQS